MSANPRLLSAAAVGVAIGLAAALVVLPQAGTSPTARVAASASPSPAPSATPAPEDPDTAEMEPGCSRSLVRSVVSSFVDAFNRRDQQALAGLFGTDFQWVSINSGDRLESWGTSDRRELPTYFASRWAKNERWVLRELRIRTDSVFGIAGAAFQIAYDRTADDLPASFIAGGKGVIGCVERTVARWAVGDHAPWGP